MTALTPQLDAALSADRPLIYGAVEINLPGYDLRLLDGSGRIAHGSDIFTGEDATFGVLAAIDEISDGMGDEAPAINITLQPATDAAAADLSDPAMQGSRVRLWLGAVTCTTGAAIVDPFLLFDGELDVPTLKVGLRSRSLEYECVSGFERFFGDDEGMRLSDSFHKSIWATETGLANMSGIIKTSYWGAETPPNSVSFIDQRTAAVQDIAAKIKAGLA
jgi:hypothetical protein